MKNIVLYNPQICSSNIGDEIIFNYISFAINKSFQTHCIVEFPTQTPVSNKILTRFKDSDYKFVCGSNLLQGNMFFKFSRKGIATHAIRQWDINLRSAKKIHPAILVGCGWQNYNPKVNVYTKKLWKKVLSNSYIHSVRDNYTAERLKSIGIKNVINTGCPTTWALTPDFCKKIPTQKSDIVVTTITEYRSDIEKDELMLNILINNYKKVYLWLQGTQDMKYFEKFDSKIKDKISIIAPRLEDYTNFLINNQTDYVGTRLHGGIHALNHKKRTIIVGVDNRAAEMNKDINLTVIDRNELVNLESKIQGEWPTEIHILQSNIDIFLSQFKKQII